MHRADSRSAVTTPVDAIELQRRVTIQVLSTTPTAVPPFNNKVDRRSPSVSTLSPLSESQTAHNPRPETTHRQA